MILAILAGWFAISALFLFCVWPVVADILREQAESYPLVINGEDDPE